MSAFSAESNTFCHRAQHETLPACPGQVKLKVGQVHFGSHLPKWAGKIPPKISTVPLWNVRSKCLGQGHFIVGQVHFVMDLPRGQET